MSGADNETLQKRMVELSERAGAGEVEQALGYLSTWGLGVNYPSVDISIDTKHDEIMAYYKFPDGRRGYSICAILRDNGKFSFHS